ncbi:hypothetical protein [uncultured Tenacibaculum sp.]|uniref:hypothetical protein n=1 Tax=uncultured Tenacibaculum sp. TaxID=174713 RepID=UPI0026245418|nr:hypothetical protein [uncultured Tenacibaculum sp.]
MIWKEQNLEHSPNSSHFEYLIDGVNLKDIIDAKYGHNAFVEQNGFLGWINEKLNLKNLRLSEQILKGEKINNLLLADDSKLLNYDFESKIPIYTCQCGDIYCSGLIINFVISDNKITWDFGDKLMPIFIFDLEQYREEIDSKIKKLKKNKYDNT